MSVANIDPKAQILFIEVQDAQAKKECLSCVAAHCFAYKIRLLFTVDNEMAAQYLDKLLWSYPLEAMLPHGMGLSTSEELVFITWQNSLNCNRAAACFNLLAEPTAMPPSAPWTFELWDMSHLERTARAEKRWQWYMSQGYHLQRSPWCRDLPLNFLQARVI